MLCVVVLFYNCICICYIVSFCYNLIMLFVAMYCLCCSSREERRLSVTVRINHKSSYKCHPTGCLERLIRKADPLVSAQLSNNMINISKLYSYTASQHDLLYAMPVS